MKNLTNYEKLQLYEEKFAYNNYDGIPGDDAYLIIKDKHSIIVSAPHAVNQIRNDNIKVADNYTGGLALLLNKELNVSVIVKTFNNKNDVNYDVNTNYERDLINFINNNNISCLIDLHKAREERPFDVEIGDANYEHIKGYEYLYPIIKGIFLNEGLIVQHNEPFNAAYKGTVSTEIYKSCNIPTIQIEINNKVMKDEETFNKLYKSLVKIIELLEDLL